jgi:hypothetical protein
VVQRRVCSRSVCVRAHNDRARSDLTPCRRMPAVMRGSLPRVRR